MEFNTATLVSLLYEKSEQKPDEVAYLFLEDEIEKGSLTFGKLITKAKAIATYLQTEQLVGERVLLLYPTGLDFIVAFIGCLYAGVIPVPVACPKLNEYEKSKKLIQTIAQSADISGIFTQALYIEKMNQEFSPTQWNRNLKISDTTSIDEKNASSYQMNSIKGEDIAYLQYTSGSTSIPKGTVVKHKNLIHNIEQSAKTWHYNKKSKTLTLAPHSHVYGLVCGLLVPLARGTSTIIMPAETIIKNPIAWLKAISKYKITHSGCPNFAYDLCIQHINNSELNNIDLSSWKVAVNGGENVKEETLIQFTKKFSECHFSIEKFCPAYGMSELTGTIAAHRHAHPPRIFYLSNEGLQNNKVIYTDKNPSARAIVSYGPIIQGLNVIVINPETLEEVGRNEIGEIWIAGKSLVSGYWRNEPETQAVFDAKPQGSKKKYFRTGDLGFIENNEIFLTGRLKEVIVIYGKKYYPIDLENTASSVLEKYDLNRTKVVVTQLINNKEEVLFLLEVTPNIPLHISNEVMEKIRGIISEIHGIDLYGIILVKENTLPKTPSGKLQRKLCKELLTNNQLQIVTQHLKEIEQYENPVAEKTDQIQLTELEFKKQFISLISRELKVPEKKLDLNKPLSVYGFDSISITKLTNEINKQFNLAITPANLFEYPTLADFYKDLFAKITLTKTPSKTGVAANPNSPISLTMPKKTSSDSQKGINDVAIIGMHGIFPEASDIDAFWNNLIKGKDSIIEIPKDRWNWEDFYGDSNEEPSKTKIKWGGFISDVGAFDAEFFNISPREAELTDPQQRLFLQVVWKTIEDAGYSTSSLSNKTTGLFVGVFNNDYEELLQKQGITDAYITTGTTHSILANRISYLMNLHGPSEAIDTACSSSLVAIHNAIRAIQDGDCEIAIAGGVNLILTPTAYLDANKAGMLSEDGRCKTFDSRANGYVRAEGVAAVLLKPLAKALEDKDHIYGVIKGTAVNHGGHVSSLTAPNPNAQAEVVAAAFRRGNIDIETINYIEAHGTGTALGDPIEIAGLTKAFEILASEEGKSFPTKAYCGLGALKTNIGHLEAAAGVAGVIKILMALKYKLIPGNIHFETQNPYIKLKDSPFYFINQTQPWDSLHSSSGEELPRRAGVSSFGFGGTNAHVVIEEYPQEIPPHEEETHRPYLIVFSAKTEQALQLIIKNFYNWMTRQKQVPSLVDICYTLALGRNHFDKRCAILVESTMELFSTLELILQENNPENYIFNYNNDFKDTLRPIFLASQKHLYDDIKNTSISVEEHRLKLWALAHFYTLGFDLNWEEMFPEKHLRISLPTYPFAKQYYWIPETIEEIDILTDQEISIGSQEDNTASLLAAIEKDLVQDVSTVLKVPTHRILLDTTLSDFGFDSISFKELAIKMENRYGIEVNPSLFFTYGTIHALSEYLINHHIEKLEKIYKAAFPLTHRIISESVPTTLAELNVDEPIAIVGMQGYLPQSSDLDMFWKHLEAGDDLITEILNERWSTLTTNTQSKWGGLVPDFDKFDANFFNISSREANLMDPQQRLFMEIVWRTIEDAGYNPFSLTGQKVGVFAGVEFNEYQTIIQATRKLYHGHIATGTSHALLANRVSYFLNLRGPSVVVDTACSSSLVAVHLAVTALQRKECSLAVAGGVSLMLNPDTVIITSQLGALSVDGRCKTFDKSANGYVKGEGVCAILLKPLSAAERDGNPIYGIIRGSAVGHGGKAQSLTAPNAAAQSELLISAYTRAKIDPETISYIETHGTGTELGDPVEIEGLKIAFNSLTHYQNKLESKKHYCGLGSVKTNIGHLEPASGIASVIKVLLSMKKETLPGILHFKELNPFIDLKETPFYIVDHTIPWKKLLDTEGNEIPRRSGVSSFGFGGTYAHLILEEPKAPQVSTQTNKPYYLICLSAKQKESLQLKAQQLLEWIQNDDINLANLGYTLNKGRAHFTHCFAMIVDSVRNLESTLSDYLKDEKRKNIFVNAETLIANDANADNLYKDALAKLSESNELTPDQYYQYLVSLADLYSKNYKIDWDTFYKNDHLNFVADLPPYPFMKQRYWFDLEYQTKMISAPLARTSVSEFTLDYLKQIFAEKLRINPKGISPDETYELYGVDSLIGLEITNRIQQDFVDLPKTILYEKNTLRQLSRYLEQKYPAILESLLGKTISTESSPQIINEAHFGPSLWSSQSHDIAIIGLSVNFPAAKNLNEFWDNLTSGRNCITEIPPERWDYKAFPVSVGGQEKFYKYGGFIPDIDKFDPLFFGVAPKEAMLMDPQERLFLQTAWATLEDAGYTRERLTQVAHNNVGVFVGVTYNFYPLFIAEEWQKGNRLPLDIQLFSVANRLSYFLNLNGPSFIVDTACSSSLSAIHLACESISVGESHLALAGGVNLSLHPSKYHFLGGYGFLSDQGQCASFAEGGSGYVPGEGVGAVLLKPLDQAIKDNDRIYGVIKASSMNHGGKTSGYTVPNPTAQSELIQKTLAKADINPRTISYIEAHGTGTSLGDPIEVRGLQDAFEQYTTDKQFCAIGSVKSNIGHLESAAGISQLAKVLLQMKYKKLVPSLHAEKLNPFINFSDSPFYVQTELEDWDSEENIRRAGISSFGAGGTNVHLIVDEYLPPEKQPTETALRKPFILILSAMNLERLKDYASDILNFIRIQTQQPIQDPDQWVSDLCYTSQVGRESMPARLAILCDSHLTLMTKLEKFIETEAPSEDVYVSQTTDVESIVNINSDELIHNAKLDDLIKFWLKGGKINWEKYYSNFYQPSLISMPTYPFAKRRCWVTTSEPIKVIDQQPQGLNEWFYSLGWDKTNTKTVTKAKDDNGHWLVFSDKELGFLLQDELPENQTTFVFEGDSFSKIDGRTFYINSNKREDYLTVFKNAFPQPNPKLKGIIYLWSIDSENQNSQLGFKLLHVFQSLIEQKWENKLLFTLICRNSQKIIAVDSINIWQHYLWSACRIFAAEQEKFDVLMLDLDRQKRLRDEAGWVTQEMANYNPLQNHIGYRGTDRFSIRLTHFEMPSENRPNPVIEAALVTGGLGALGGELAKWLISKGTQYLLLTGTTPLPPRDEWKNITDPTLVEKIKLLTELEALDVKVHYQSVNIVDKDEMLEVIQHVETLWNKPITGVFHLAGITTDSLPMTTMTDEIMAEVLSAKVQGSLVLHEIFDKPNLNCFVLFSSIASLPFFGMSGLSAYAMANEFLNGLALYRQQEGLPALSIDWAAWSEKGMSHRYDHGKFLEAVGMSTISIAKGLDIFDELMSKSIQKNLIVFKVNWEKFFQVNALAKRLDFFTHFSKKFAKVTTKTIRMPKDEVHRQTLEALARVLQLEKNEIDSSLPYSSYGMDSIIGINFIGELGKVFPEIVSPMDLYKYPTVNSLVNYILEKLESIPVEPETKSDTIIEIPTDETMDAILNLKEEEISKLIEDEFVDIDKLMDSEAK